MRDLDSVGATPLRIALVENERVTRVELERMLSHHPQFQIVAGFPSAESALDGLAEARVDLVLMDLNLGRASGAECTRRLKEKFPRLKIVVLTKYEDADHIFAALRAGADGYMLKKFKEAELPAAIQQAVAGGAPMSGEVAARVLKYFRSAPASSAIDALSPREREVLQLLARGFAYKEIAAELGVARDTVNDHIRRIYRKLQVHSALEAVKVLHGG